MARPAHRWRRLFVGTLAAAFCASIWLGHSQHTQLIAALADKAKTEIERDDAIKTTNINSDEVDFYAAAYHQCIGRYLVRKQQWHG